MKRKIKTGEFGTIINPEKQFEHNEKTRTNPQKSYLYDCVSAQKLFDEFAGTGEVGHLPKADDRIKRRSTLDELSGLMYKLEKKQQK